MSAAPFARTAQVPALGRAGLPEIAPGESRWITLLRRMHPYAVYGPFYDATQGKPDGAQYLHLLRRHRPRARTVLEIACGTGSHLEPLAEHYEVAGLDISPTMLRYARQRLPAIPLHCQNMAGFELETTFDAVICPYDSMNHLLRFSDWIRTFKAAKRHLNPKGVFIFDINTEHKLRKLAGAPAWTHRFAENQIVMKVSISPNGVADWDIRVFECLKGRNYRLHHEIIKERSFNHATIREALRSCFNSVSAYDRAGWSRPKATSERLFYACR